MFEGYNIICFAPTDWWAMNPSCNTHIMRKLADKNRILFINPFSSDLMGERKNICRRIPRKIKSTLKCLRQPYNNLYVYSPVFLPLQGNRIIDEINNFFLQLQIKLLCSYLKIKKPILWVENVRAADMLNWFSPKLTVFHVSDLFSKSRYTGNKEILQAKEDSITTKSDLIICVSQSLYEIKSSQHKNVFYLPHGVDFDLFREAVDKNIRLEEVANIPRPIAGYYGTMTANNDIELLLWCARQLPTVSFVFAGQITSGNYSVLESLPNVYLLGKLPYEKIPRLCASFDVCMLQWKMTEWIQNCNPLKMIEYMASGKPIVSVPIKEVEKYSDIVSIAKNKEDFCAAIMAELNSDTPERAAKRIKIASQHSWNKNIEIISQLITKIITAKSTNKGFHS